MSKKYLIGGSHSEKHFHVADTCNDKFLPTLLYITLEKESADALYTCILD